jgi:hypothetical protein
VDDRDVEPVPALLAGEGWRRTIPLATRKANEVARRAGYREPIVLQRGPPPERCGRTRILKNTD